MAVMTCLIAQLADIDLDRIYTRTVKVDAFLSDTFSKWEYGRMHNGIILSPASYSNKRFLRDIATPHLRLEVPAFLWKCDLAGLAHA
jgi:hypothetical protein